ncbi:KHG/KDPG aldolase isoform X4 [Manihot esculenta]|uniref:KHG/KDPG aldolase isoform X4 n=1 Tax=Manihot esculenta TaxID=3983 RepID=UPI001CC59DB5|nr:KHG/KDPG aldolase isoform X4 [Manihot esculenta]
METIGVSVCSWRPSLPPQSPPNLKRFRVSSSSSPLAFTPTRENTLSLIHNSGVIACLRANSAELAFEAASAALRGGISVLEIVMSTPGFTTAGAGTSYSGLGTQVGTLLNVEDAIKAKRAGAKFLMSPAMVMGIVDVIQDGEILYIPGAMTPTEILSAYDAGSKIVKVYPVSALGGFQYISALKKPFPHISLVASQGIMIDSIGDYISCGASSVVLSDAIFNKEAMAQQNFNTISQLASVAALQGKEAVLRFDAHQTRRTEDY